MIEPMVKQFANPSPMPVGEPRTRDERITDERRANHGRETCESRTRDERITDEGRTNHGRETNVSRPVCADALKDTPMMTYSLIGTAQKSNSTLSVQHFYPERNKNVSANGHAISKGFAYCK